MEELIDDFIESRYIFNYHIRSPEYRVYEITININNIEIIINFIWDYKVVNDLNLKHLEQLIDINIIKSYKKGI